ncbi:FEL protein, partial [Amia calva]|nr:FEL protein [Amia calva]
SFIPLAGNLIQIGAGGDKFVVGCNPSSGIVCLNHRPALSYDGSGNEILVKLGVSGNSCPGPEKWYRIPGSLSMVEVSADGEVHGLNKHGSVFKRIVINACNPFGSRWELLRVAGISRSVSYTWSPLDCLQKWPKSRGA